MEIIHCKDCHYYKRETKQFKPRCFKLLIIQEDPNFYCGYGIRKKGENNETKQTKSAD